jgi:hypothetical protein
MTGSTLETSEFKYGLLKVGFALTIVLEWAVHYLWSGIGSDLSVALQIILCSANLALGFLFFAFSRHRAVIALPVMVGIVMGQWPWLWKVLLLMALSGIGHTP